MLERFYQKDISCTRVNDIQIFVSFFENHKAKGQFKDYLPPLEF